MTGQPYPPRHEFTQQRTFPVKPLEEYEPKAEMLVGIDLGSNSKTGFVVHKVQDSIIYKVPEDFSAEVLKDQMVKLFGEDSPLGEAVIENYNWPLHQGKRKIVDQLRRDTAMDCLVNEMQLYGYNEAYNAVARVSPAGRERIARQQDLTEKLLLDEEAPTECYCNAVNNPPCVYCTHYQEEEENVVIENQNQEDTSDYELQKRLVAEENEERIDKKIKIAKDYKAKKFENGSFYHFEKKFVEDGEFYPYLCMKTEKGWYITGKDAAKLLTEQELVLFLCKGNYPVAREDFIRLVVEPVDVD